SFSKNGRSRIRVQPATALFPSTRFLIIRRGRSRSTTTRRLGDSKAIARSFRRGSTGIHRFTVLRLDTTPPRTNPAFHSPAKRSTPQSERKPERKTYPSSQIALRHSGLHSDCGVHCDRKSTRLH